MGSAAVTGSGALRLVPGTAEQMRELILAQAPGASIGSLPEVAKRLGVGIATVQQAARVLEHEGLLAVRRGPGGGYFGARPDAAALERSVGVAVVRLVVQHHDLLLVRTEVAQNAAHH